MPAWFVSSGRAREYDGMTAGLRHADLVHSIEGAPARQRDRDALQLRLDVIDARDLDEQTDRGPLRPRHRMTDVLVDARPGLIHDFGGVLVEDDEPQRVAVRHLHALRPTEAIEPERQARLDGVDVQHRCELLRDVGHGLPSLLSDRPCQHDYLGAYWRNGT